MIKKVLLPILMMCSFIAFSQSSTSTITKRQTEAINNLLKYKEYFGLSITRSQETGFYLKTQTRDFFFKSIYTKDKVTLKRKTYYGIKFHVEFDLKNVKYVYEDENKLVFYFNSNGYIMNIKAPRENWIGMRKYTNNYILTVNNSSIRKKVLKELRYLIKNPIYKGEI